MSEIEILEKISNQTISNLEYISIFKQNFQNINSYDDYLHIKNSFLTEIEDMIMNISESFQVFKTCIILMKNYEESSILKNKSDKESNENTENQKEKKESKKNKDYIIENFQVYIQNLPTVIKSDILNTFHNEKENRKIQDINNKASKISDMIMKIISNNDIKEILDQLYNNNIINILTGNEEVSEDIINEVDEVILEIERLREKDLIIEKELERHFRENSGLNKELSSKMNKSFHSLNPKYACIEENPVLEIEDDIADDRFISMSSSMSMSLRNKSQSKSKKIDKGSNVGKLNKSSNCNSNSNSNRLKQKKCLLVKENTGNIKELNYVNENKNLFKNRIYQYKTSIASSAYGENKKYIDFNKKVIVNSRLKEYNF